MTPEPEGACACGSGAGRDACCGAFLDGRALAPTAEALMRARYVAFVEGNMGFIEETLHPKALEHHDADGARRWSQKSEWVGLEVVDVEGGQPDDRRGEVEFIARFRQRDEVREHHERATFLRDGDRWVFFDGSTPAAETVVRQGPRIGRNDPCPCGSGKKHKRCCGR